ncbi:hypothetical protein BDV98DRAFT_595755 [Pterulicium gracile]|uniref:LysM domain-containing protein n=1 Tax=Pterulicium gracile TaxID=1884261 RepID=A0A5C3QEH5_9AGAR|nr:hypothetical protein BDV98DRAFT_595755 [Pterula gracilis]
MLRSLVAVVALLTPVAFAADCKVAVVGKPHSGCWDIANAAGITTTQLSNWNSGLNCNLLQPNQRLCVSSGTLPDISPKPNANGSCFTHKVLPESTCAVIANQYGITVSKIEEFNKKTYKWKGKDTSSLLSTIVVLTFGSLHRLRKPAERRGHLCLEWNPSSHSGQP